MSSHLSRTIPNDLVLKEKHDSSSRVKSSTQSQNQNQNQKQKQSASTLQIYARLRVIMPWESDTLSTTVKDHRTVINKSKKRHNAYEFNRVFLPTDTNNKVFKSCCKPLLNRVLQGFNAIFIAYGQTGSGKTYSVLGNPSSTSKTSGSQEKTQGILGLSIKYLLNRSNVNRIEISAVETFGHHVQKVLLYDLGDSKNQIAEWHKKEGSTTLQPSKCTKILIKNKRDIDKIVSKLHSASHFAPTGKNPQSSRGHVTFVVSVTMDQIRSNSNTTTRNHSLQSLRSKTNDSSDTHTHTRTTSDDTAEVKTKEINEKENDNTENSVSVTVGNDFDTSRAVKDIEKNVSESVLSHWIVVDLAGSEGESALTKDFLSKCDSKEITARRLEAWCINHGLIQLQSFFNEMRGGKKNSKNNVSGTGFGLRRTLNEYINQKSFISVLFTISPSSDNRKATESTLRFAETAALVKCTPVKAKKKLNKDAMIAQLQRFMEKQQRLLGNQKTKILELEDVVEQLKQTNANNMATMANMTSRKNIISMNQLTSINETIDDDDEIDFDNMESIRFSDCGNKNNTSKKSKSKKEERKEQARQRRFSMPVNLSDLSDFSGLELPKKLEEELEQLEFENDLRDPDAWKAASTIKANKSAVNLLESQLKVEMSKKRRLSRTNDKMMKEIIKLSKDMPSINEDMNMNMDMNDNENSDDSFNSNSTDSNSNSTRLENTISPTHSPDSNINSHFDESDEKTHVNRNRNRNGNRNRSRMDWQDYSKDELINMMLDYNNRIEKYSKLNSENERKIKEYELDINILKKKLNKMNNRNSVLINAHNNNTRQRLSISSTNGTIGTIGSETNFPNVIYPHSTQYNNWQATQGAVEKRTGLNNSNDWDKNNNVFSPGRDLTRQNSTSSSMNSIKENEFDIDTNNERMGFLTRNNNNNNNIDSNMNGIMLAGQSGQSGQSSSSISLTGSPRNPQYNERGKYGYEMVSTRTSDIDSSLPPMMGGINTRNNNISNINNNNIDNRMALARSANPNYGVSNNNISMQSRGEQFRHDININKNARQKQIYINPSQRGLKQKQKQKGKNDNNNKSDSASERKSCGTCCTVM